MSYVVIRVYSFECDLCGEICEIGAEPNLRTAERALRRTEHWRTPDGSHICPAHLAVAEERSQ